VAHFDRKSDIMASKLERPMIDMTLAELLTGLNLSDEEIAAELETGKQDGADPESKTAPAPGKKQPE
jgi:hypothetical protein